MVLWPYSYISFSLKLGITLQKILLSCLFNLLDNMPIANITDYQKDSVLKLIVTFLIHLGGISR